ncbi:SDR family oxidoreductase [Streptococcus macacae]|uniref:NmrA family protein n=1 Tax=Streptococcus macacae NCTC 11558 TaxID=764298 RepID=G5JWL7_9STRE|nr:SDR family oxidoreductase [Streptococcus macacae]EHJ52671.1 NmrA family protein [Streptococcus macacae NCTC 11558]
MKVFVAGSTGRVATELIKQLRAKGHTVLAGARKPEAVVAGEGVTAVKMDLHQDAAELEKLLENVDAVIFTAGSRGKDLLQVDAFGAVKLMQACQKTGIKRFVMLSALLSLEPESWSQVANLSDYYVAKYFADNYLVHQSGLDYTIIQPGQLLEEAGSGQISLGKEGLTAISILDVAAVLAEVLDKPSTYKKVFEIHPGQTAITKAF